MKSLNLVKYLIIISFLICFGCADELEKSDLIQPKNPTPKSGRMLGIKLPEGNVGLDSALSTSRKIGNEVVEQMFKWNDVETNQGVFSDPGEIFKSMTFYGDNQVNVILTIDLMNQTNWEIPEYLKSVKITQTKFISAFNEMIQWVLSEIPKNVTVIGISIGNEVDLYLKTDNEWQTYTDFYEAVSGQLRAINPEIKTGVKITFTNGVIDSHKVKTKIINNITDVVMFNYYPVNKTSYVVNNPDIVFSDFNTMVSEFNKKPIWILGMGYPSGETFCKSSEVKQSNFYHHLFTAWDQNEPKIRLVLIDAFHDLAPQQIDSIKSISGFEPGFAEFQSTLGIRTSNGIEKIAWHQILLETKARGW